MTRTGSPCEILLVADVLQTFAALVNNPILGAHVDEVIGNGNCANVTGEVKFAASGNTDTFTVTLMDQGGTSAFNDSFSSAAGGGIVVFDGIDACGLDDGILKLSVELGSLDPFVGTPAVKLTLTLPAPVLDPLGPVSVFSMIEVCGTHNAPVLLGIPLIMSS